MSFNKPTQTSAEESAELLRMTLPLMARHKIPVTPVNYAVWYSYVSRNNGALNAEIDRLIAIGGTFSDDVNQRLFQQSSALRRFNFF